VLTDDAFNAIQAGMTSADVFARIGPPYAKSRFDATRTTAWDYHYRDAWGYDADFSVIVDDGGAVTGKAKVRNGN
jgi:outer membrane protein assembly factor BamE (lipoprotein component of BamABCDE complex)